jgi:GTP cyclohydrolase II
MQNNRYKLARTIADIRNGFCMLIVKNASKTFYFTKNTIHPDVLTNLPNYEIVTTKELYNFNNKSENSAFNVVLKNDMSFSCNANDSDNMAIQIAKIAEIQPVLLKITDQNYTPEVPFETINYDDINFAINHFQYELTFLAKAKIQLSIAQNCEIYAFGSKFGGHQHYAILVNNPLLEQTPLVRVHSSCYTGDLISSLRCDCGDQLKNSIIEMNKTSGILLYIMQEGRGIGLANKIKAYELQQSCGLDTVESNLALGFEGEERSFIPAAEMLKFFKKTEIKLMTNNPKKGEDLLTNGIMVKELTPTYFKPHKENQVYLQIKKEKMGHIL